MAKEGHAASAILQRIYTEFRFFVGVSSSRIVPVLSIVCLSLPFLPAAKR